MIRRAVVRLFARLPLRGPRVHPEFLAACDRARLERLTGRELGPSVPVEDDIVPDVQPGALDWARERAAQPYRWSHLDDWSWVKEHEAEIRRMWLDPMPEHSVRESELSDEERAAWAEIVACWRRA